MAVLSDLIDKLFQEGFLLIDWPVSDHFSKLFSGVFYKIIPERLRIHNYVPEKATDFALELLISTYFSKIAQTIKLS